MARWHVDTLEGCAYWLSPVAPPLQLAASNLPLGLEPADFTGFAIRQFQKRMDRLERARGASLEEIDRVTATVIECRDA